MLFVCPGCNGLHFLSSHCNCRLRQGMKHERLKLRRFTSELQIDPFGFSIAGVCLSVLKRIDLKLFSS